MTIKFVRSAKNWKVLKDGRHVDALVTLADKNGLWSLYGMHEAFSEEEMQTINEKIKRLNTEEPRRSLMQRDWQGFNNIL